MAQADPPCPGPTASPDPSAEGPSPEAAPPPPAAGPPPEVAPNGPSPTLTRLTVLALLLFLAVFVATQGWRLWGEWHALSGDLAGARFTTVVGYKNISPQPSYAAHPADWLHDQGENSLLWSGWTPGVGHGWFKVGKGDLDRSRLIGPLGKDTIQAIDHPLTEVGDGKRWRRVPYDAPVAGLVLDGTPCAYPILVLRTVEVVNDQVGARPFLVTYSPFSRPEETIHVYDPVVDGRRVVLGHSGYLHDRKPLLYDQETESLWVEQDCVMTAIAGRMKGARLKCVARPSVLTWSDWRSDHPDSRLLVGADRPKARPAH